MSHKSKQLLTGGIIVMLVVLLVIFIIQNADEAAISFLAWDFSTPLSVLVVISFLLGAIVGGLYVMISDFLKNRRNAREAQLHQYVAEVEHQNQELRQELMEKKQ